MLQIVYVQGKGFYASPMKTFSFEPLHMISNNVVCESLHMLSNNVVCATSNGSDQPANTRSLIRAFACHLNIL